MAKTNPARSLEWMPLEDLRADPLNPKAHDLDVIGESVGRFGYVEPVVLDGRTGYIVSGHGRTESLRERYAAEPANPPEGVMLGDDGAWLVPVMSGWSSANDHEARAALVALNRTGQLGGWDDAALLDVLDALAAEDEEGLQGVGYSDHDIADLHRLADGHGDLDDIADQWTGGGMPSAPGAGGGGETSRITVSREDVVEAWSVHRARFETDDDALYDLLKP